MFVTGGAGGAARAASRVTAAGAAAGAVLAEGRFAALAARPVTDLIAAVGAGDAEPLVERAVGAVGVVSSERLGDDREEVEQSPFAERPADRRKSLALAKLFVTDVGMDERVVIRRGAGRLGADEVREGSGSAATPGKFDFKRSELNSFQDDRLGDDRYQRFPQIDAHLLKLAR